MRSGRCGSPRIRRGSAVGGGEEGHRSARVSDPAGPADRRCLLESGDLPSARWLGQGTGHGECGLRALNVGCVRLAFGARKPLVKATRILCNALRHAAISLVGSPLSQRMLVASLWNFRRSDDLRRNTVCHAPDAAASLTSERVFPDFGQLAANGQPVV